MYIGREMKKRMDMFGFSEGKLAEESLVSELIIKDILDNKVNIEEIDEFDMSLLSSALHCDPEYFTNETIRKSDIVNAAENRGNETEKSINAKAKVQDYINDLAFVNSLM